MLVSREVVDRHLESLFAILQGRQHLHACVVSGNLRRRSFYRKIDREFNVRCVVLRPSGTIPRLIGTLLGERAMIVCNVSSSPVELCARLSEQGLLQVLLLGGGDCDAIVDIELARSVAVAMYEFDEDSADSDGLLVENIYIHENCPQDIGAAISAVFCQ